MGTKRPSCTLFDTLSNINTSDHKLKPGGKISRDPSPRPAMTAQSERERESKREEEWRRERETEKMRDKVMYRDVDPRGRYYERDRAPAPRLRDGEREWREREKRQEDESSRNGRPLSNVEKETEREVERGKKKGDTFPSVRISSADRGRKMMPATEMDEERGDRKQRDKPRRIETDNLERERQRERYRDKERDDFRSRAKEEGKYIGGDEKLRQRERYQSDAGFQDKRRGLRSDSWDRREMDAARKREKPRSNMGERGARMPSPHRRRDREIYLDRKEREKAQWRDGGRSTRSEGDSDERELRRERARDREREEVMYQHSKSEGDSTGKTAREKNRDRLEYREEDRQRHRDREVNRSRQRSEDRRGVEKDGRYREVDRTAAARVSDWEGGRWNKGQRDLIDDRGRSGDMRENERYREYEQRRGREREDDPRWDDTTGRSRVLNEAPPRVPPRAQSSGEWSSDMDSETRYRRGYKERKAGRENTTGSGRDAEEMRSPERTAERQRGVEIRSKRLERGGEEMTGSVPEQRRMWLEPQRGKNSNQSSLEEEFVDKEKHTRWKEGKREEERVMESRAERRREKKDESDERYSDQSGYRGRHSESTTRGGRNKYSEQRGDIERQAEGVSVDGEEVDEDWREIDKAGKECLSDSSGGTEGRQQKDVEGGGMTEESDREEDGGSDYWARSESEGGSERGWKQERDRMLSGEDDFVTVDSSGDAEQDEEEFEDCHEFWEGGVARDAPSPFGFKGNEGNKELTTGQEELVDEEEQGTEKQTKYIFCVVGQTLPRSKTRKMSPSQVDQIGGVEKDNPDLASHHHCSDDITQKPQEDLPLTLKGNDESLINNENTEAQNEDIYNVPREEKPIIGEATEVDIRVSSELQDTETRERMKEKHPYAEKSTIKRDSQTEKLLIEWREKNKELTEQEGKDADVCSQMTFEGIQSNLDGINTEAISPEEKESWSMSEEPKRHSQAPHLKWAKNVVQEILGHSEKHTVDDPNSKVQRDTSVDQSETAISNNKQQEEVAHGTREMDEAHSKPDLEEKEEEEPLEVEGLRGMGQSQKDMHADLFTAMHDDAPTYTHADIVLDTEKKEDHSPAMDKKAEPSGDGLHVETVDIKVTVCDEVKITETEKEENRQKEVEMYLSVSNTLYKPNSCPVLNYDSMSDLLVDSRQDEGRDVGDTSRPCEIEKERQGEEPEESCTAEEVVATISSGENTEVEMEVTEKKKEKGTLISSCSFRNLGPEVRLRRRGIRKTTERRHEELVENEEEEEGVGRDRRTRIFSATDVDDRSKSWGEVELRNVLDTIGRRKRNSKFFNAAQLYQQYSEAAQNFEILWQSRSDVHSVCEDTNQSPAPSPPPARRPLPPLPPVPHPHSLAHTDSITSVKSLPLPEPPKNERRSSSPRLSSCLTQSSTLWRELPAVRNSTELEKLTEDQRRLQEVRFEVVTSEASYCRSLDIVVEHFVKCKQLGALLGTQDRNWLFSRLADVRAISHSFLSKLEEQLESDIMHFTVCDIIARHCQRFKMVYVPYLTNQSYQDATYQRLMNENSGFKRIVEKLERSPVCQRLPLRSFLVLPFQRITRIKLLVQNIVKRTTPGTAEATQAIKSLKLLEKLIQESNDSITQMKSIESLVSLSAKVDFECRTLPLISQSRRLVREGAVTELMDFSLKDTERNVYLHLFNDYLLLSLQKEGGRFTVIDHSPVSEMRAENCRVKLHSLQKNLFQLHMTHKSLLLRTDTLSDKLRWISAISRPHPEIDFSAAQDFQQMQCIRAFVGQQPDELSLEKADIILVHQQSSDHWVEGTRLSDKHRGWVPETHLETISNSRVRQRNLSDALKLTTAKAAV
ncbi:hypothetical protein PAMA_015284 [Pampus argenteus]